MTRATFPWPVLIGIGLLSACGTNSISTNAASTTQGLTQGSPSTDFSSSSSGSTSAVTVNAAVPAISLRVGTIGYNPVSVSVGTRSILKVKFQPGIQDESIAGTNFEPEYSMLGVYITVGSSTQATDVVTNGYNGTVAGTSSVIDFSSAIPSGSNGTVSIVVAQPNYDYDCLNYELYCYPVPWMHVMDTHPWHGTLIIQTDETAAI